MNLIEQLGGYEAALKFRDLCKSDIDGDIPNNTKLYDHKFGEFCFGELQTELLEYRRQNNIYEVGDWIVMDSHKPEYQFYQITKDDMGSHWINLVEFRHATDAEIKAGKRL